MKTMIGLAVAVSVCSATTATTLPATAYVQEGLVVQYDGLENAGLGVHADGITAWKDLTGNGHDLPLNEGDMVGADCVNIVRATRTASNDLFSAYASITIEYNARPTAMDAAGNWDAPIATIPYIGAFGWDGRKGAIQVRRPQSATATAYYYRSYNSGYNMLSDILNAAKYQTYAACPGYGNGGSSADDPVYVNGAKVAKTTGLTWSGGTRSTSFLLTIGNAKTASDVRAIRIYSRPLTATEIKINNAVDKVRFEGVDMATVLPGYHYNATLGRVVPDGYETTLFVDGTPEDVGTPVPAYGATTIAAGAAMAVSAPAWTNAVETIAATCTGWKIYDDEGNVLSTGTGSAFTYVHPDPAMYRRLEWQWAYEYKVTATAMAGGSASPAAQWVANGATATVTATPEAAHGFYRWTNNVPASVVATDATISFPVTAPMTLFATFGSALYVAEDGDDANGGTSWDDAFATLEQAHSIAPHGTTILVGTGTYAMGGRITITNDVFIRGAGPDASFIDCANAGGRPFTISCNLARIENLRIYNGPEIASYNGGGIYMSGGVVANCTISNCIGKINSGGAGGIYMTGGIVTNCLITRCESKLTGSGYPQGSGIAQHGGLVTDCRFVANRSTGWQNGVGIYIDKGVCERSVFTGHTQGTPIYNAGGTVRNCLVYGNRTGTSSFAACKRYGGVFQSSGSLYNCTIVGNHSGKGVGGLQAEGGNVVNNIVWNNDSSDGTVVGYYFAGSGAFRTNLLDTATEAGIGNFSSDPCFVDAGQNDYHLGQASLAINAAAPLAGVVNDLDGADRPFGSAPEIGCYEYTTVAAELTCLVRALITEYCAGEAFSFTSVVEGPDLAGLQYAWSIDGVAHASGANLSECDFPATLEPGRHTISLTVSNTAGDSASDEVIVSILPLTTYVAEDGDDEANFPYHTAEQPAATFSAALSAVWKSLSTTSHVFLAEGTYPLGNPVSIAQPIEITGAGAGATTLDCTGIAGRAFYLNHKDAEVRDLTVAHARPSTSGTPGGAFYLVNGTVDSCIITNCAGYTMSGGAIYMTGGTLRDSVVTRCQVLRTGSGYTHGEGALVSGGVVSGCSFVANYPEGRYSNGIGLEMTEGNAVVENCVFTGHKATPLMFASGTVRNCLIYGNEASAIDNSNNRKTGGVYMSGGTLYNCTIVTNRNFSSTTGSAGLRMAGGRAVNNVIWGNPSEDGSAGVTIASGSTFTTNLVDATISSAGTEVGTVVSPSSPFKRPAVGDYRLKMGSKAVGIGDNAIWNGVDNPTDLDGNPRIIPRRGAVDAGCYELQRPGCTVLLLQ